MAYIDLHEGILEVFVEHSVTRYQDMTGEARTHLMHLQSLEAGREYGSNHRTKLKLTGRLDAHRAKKNERENARLERIRADKVAHEAYLEKRRGGPRVVRTRLTPAEVNRAKKERLAARLAADPKLKEESLARARARNKASYHARKAQAK